MVSPISSQQSQIGEISTQKAAGTPAGGSAQTSQELGNCTPCTNCGKCGNPQDPSTVTQDQLKSPIDLRV